MEYLLDTHTLIWFLEDDKQLSPFALENIINSKSNCFVSIASIWELAIKVGLKKISLNYSFEELARLLYNNNIQLLPITFQDIIHLNNLPNWHKDPFDRIIVSQSIHNNLTIISKDSFFKQYTSNIIW
jgi:PIN domain nuclease of toxin-antitoxin system